MRAERYRGGGAAAEAAAQRGCAAEAEGAVAEVLRGSTGGAAALRAAERGGLCIEGLGRATREEGVNGSPIKILLHKNKVYIPNSTRHASLLTAEVTQAHSSNS